MQTKDSFKNAKTARLHYSNSLLGNYWGCTSKTNKETKVPERVDPAQGENEGGSGRTTRSREGPQKTS